MLLRILVGLGLVAAGYYFGRVVGRREAPPGGPAIARESGPEANPEPNPVVHGPEQGDAG